MEDDKKKKKNKRKKNKQQTKAANSVADDTKAASSVADDTTSSNAGETSSLGTVSGEHDNGSNIVIDDKPIHNANGTVSVDSEKQNWLQEEARLRDMVKQLLYEKDSYLQRQADLEMRIKQLQSENDSWHQKRLSLEQRINQLLQEKAAWTSEERNLLEKCHHYEKKNLSLVEKENISKEMIETLNNENARLKMQVLEVEGAKDSLMHENRLLLDNISILQSRVQDLEMSLPAVDSPADAQKDNSEKDNLNAQMEEAYTLIERLITENAELVEKVNELNVELGQQAGTPDVTSVDMPEDSSKDPTSTLVKDVQEDISLSAKRIHFGTVPIGDKPAMNDEINSNYANVVQHSSETTVPGEIVQIPLDEIESQDLEAQESVSAEDESVPLADAPLIGAPFRFISFFANYVSGADLVNKGSSNSPQ